MTEPSSMTVSEWIARTESALSDAGIETARLDALVLLSDELQKDKSWLLAYSDYTLQGSELQGLNTKVVQRVSHTPLAYIRGRVEFYGNSFLVNSSVLVPRPESESFLEILRALDVTSFSAIVDVGTGSGALAVSAALLYPTCPLYATDISGDALEIAQKNAQMHTVVLTFLPGDLIDPISDSVLDGSLLLCNLPYVPTDYPINKAATYEPKLALFSGKDGLEHYAALFMKVAARTTKPRYILTESLLPQHAALQSLASQTGYHEQSVDGLVQLFQLNQD